MDALVRVDHVGRGPLDARRRRQPQARHEGLVLGGGLFQGREQRRALPRLPDQEQLGDDSIASGEEVEAERFVLVSGGCSLF
jgi:hypothetical protein